MEKFVSLNANIDNTNVSKFDKYLSKRYFVLSDNYDVILNKTTGSRIRLYDSEDEYDINSAPNCSYYDNSENVWCIDVDEDDFNSFDEKNIKYEYYRNIFIGEIVKILRYYISTGNDVKKLIGKHL
jgi:hypothetical protein